MDELKGETDGRLWARFFIEAVRANSMLATDEEFLAAFFALAIGAGFDKGHDMGAYMASMRIF